jgi:hypothetical protein
MSDDYEDYEDVPQPRLGRQEAALIRRDLDDLAAFRHTFEPEGFKGVSLFCVDCAEEHYYEWQMLEHNLEELLKSGETPVHEPAFDPKPDEYVNWEYAQGYLDGLADGGMPALPTQTTATGGCPFCGAQLPEQAEHLVFCPLCGTHLGPARIARALLDRGWSVEDVSDLLRGARIPPMRGLSES